MVERVPYTAGRLFRERLEDSKSWEDVHKRNYPGSCGADFWRGYNSAVHRLMVDLGVVHAAEIDDPGRLGPDEAILERRSGIADRRQRHEGGHGRRPDDVLENGNGE